jgi:hypothetical protein
MSIVIQTDEKFNATLQAFNLHIIRGKFWADVKDACTGALLRVYRPHCLDDMTAEQFADDIEQAIDEYEPVALRQARGELVERESPPRNPLTGRFRRYGG